MNMAELQTAVRLKQNLLVIVLNNRGYGSEYHKLLLRGLDARDSAFDDPMDFVAVAQAMGATARRADDVADVPGALRELLATDGVRLLDVSIALTPMSEVYQRQYG
jgi:acetolactate synthase-1/2/3 large subunit